MPLHDFRCPDGHTIESYVEHGVESIECPRCKSVAPKVFLTAPMVHGDLPGYHSPVTGKWIEGRRARKEDLKRTGSRPYEDGERQEFERRRASEEAAFDKSLENTIEGEIASMPARKKELLEQEVRAGASVEVQRRTT